MSGQAVTMQGTGERWMLGHQPALDGIRGIAILLVIARHTGAPWFEGGGFAGVCLFFVLSGFLITTLLLGEHQQTGRVSLRRFYTRRARRLLPAMVATTLAVVAVSPWLPSWWFQWRDLPPALLYYGNWISAGGGHLGALGGTWSLGIEEQFYLLWPLALMFLLRHSRRAALLACAVGMCASLVTSAALTANGATLDRIYYGSDTAMLPILAGAALAISVSGRHVWRGSVVVSFLAAAAVLMVATSSAGMAVQIGPAVTAAAGVALIAAVTGARRAGWLEARWLTWVGRRSYGIYLWHCPLAWLLWVHAQLSWLLVLAVMVPAAFVLAEASHRWIEAPFRRRLPDAGHVQARLPDADLHGLRPLPLKRQGQRVTGSEQPRPAERVADLNLTL